MTCFAKWHCCEVMAFAAVNSTCCVTVFCSAAILSDSLFNMVEVRQRTRCVEDRGRGPVANTERGRGTLSADDRCSVPAANTERAWSRLGSG